MITYRVSQRQYVSVTSGNVYRVWGESGLPTVVIFRIESNNSTHQPSVTAGGAVVGIPDAMHGKDIYSNVCAACHGATREGLAGPALTGVGQRLSVGEIAAWIMNPIAPDSGVRSAAMMPRLYPAALSEQQVPNVAAYAHQL